MCDANDLEHFGAGSVVPRHAPGPATPSNALGRAHSEGWAILVRLE